MPRLAILDGTLKCTDDPAAKEPAWGTFAPLRWIKVAADALTELVRLHRAWHTGEGPGRRADLSGADLSGAHLSGADLSGAHLRGADLSGADLSGAHLRGAHLRAADLSGAHLSGAHLRGADLRGADLRGADLSGADLSGADLSGAHLPSPTVVLLAIWGTLAADLTVDLMRYDASCHPEPEAFDRWAAGGACPYSGVKVQRAAQFSERRDLWSPGPSPRPYDLMVRVLAEKCPEWDEAKRAAFEATFAEMRKAHKVPPTSETP